MGKKIKMHVRSLKCQLKGCDCGKTAVHADDYVKGQITIETKGVAHPGIKIKPGKRQGHDGTTLDPNSNSAQLGSRRKK